MHRWHFDLPPVLVWQVVQSPLTRSITYRALELAFLMFRHGVQFWVPPARGLTPHCTHIRSRSSLLAHHRLRFLRWSPHIVRNGSASAAQDVHLPEARCLPTHPRADFFFISGLSL